jgi:intein-encoded DNA endonuclease-like protein
MEKLLLNEVDVISQYKELKNIHKVANYFKVSTTPIRNILKKNSIILSNRRYEVDEKYFDIIDNEEKAYWLGFLYADGYIRERKSGNSLEMKLSIKDKHHLELFRKSIESNHKITDGFNNVKYKGKISTSHMSSLVIYSTKLVESIKTQGFHSRKTFTISNPNIDEEFINHFIRGYFDGDGSFSFNPKKYIIKTQIVSASEEFQKFIINELKNNNIKINLYSEIKLQIQNKMDNQKFYNYIYKNATIFLERKKEKYEEFRRYYGYDN